MTQNQGLAKLVLIGYSSVVLAKIAMRLVSGTNIMRPDTTENIRSALQKRITIATQYQNQCLVNYTNLHFSKFYSVLSRYIKYALSKYGSLSWEMRKMVEFYPECKGLVSQTQYKKQDTVSMAPTYPILKFDDIKGFEDIKKELKSQICHFNKAETRCETQKRIKKGFVLFGPPISQRSLLVNALAGEAKCGLLAISSFSADGSFSCNGERIDNTQDFIINVKRYSPCIVFFDHFQLDCSQSTTFLQALIKDVDKGKEEQQIIVIAAVSKLKNTSDLDRNFLGSLDILQMVDLNFNKRKEVLMYHLESIQYDPNLDIDKLTHSMNGRGVKEIQHVVTGSARKAELQNRTEVNLQDIDYMMMANKPSPSRSPNSYRSSSPGIRGGVGKKRISISRSNSSLTSIQSVNSFFCMKRNKKFSANDLFSPLKTEARCA